MHHRHTLAIAGSALALAISLVSTSVALGVSQALVPDANSDNFLLHSAWAAQNGVDNVDCTGVGPARKLATGTNHASFRCRVEVGGKPTGVVTAKGLGPEWLRVSSIVSGKLKPDGGLGALPTGTPSLDSSQAGTALEESSWGTKNEVQATFCSGVGPYRDTGPSLLYFAFSCSTLDPFGSRGPQVLVTAASKRSVRILRTLVP